MSGIITNVTTVVNAAIGWVGNFVDLVTDTPLLLLGATVPFVGLGIGLLKRLIRG